MFGTLGINIEKAEQAIEESKKEVVIKLKKIENKDAKIKFIFEDSGGIQHSKTIKKSKVENLKSLFFALKKSELEAEYKEKKAKHEEDVLRWKSQMEAKVKKSSEALSEAEPEKVFSSSLSEYKSEDFIEREITAKERAEVKKNGEFLEYQVLNYL